MELGQVIEAACQTAQLAVIREARECLLDRDDVYMHRGELNYAANYNPIKDNLLDLSHVAFVHEKTIGRKVQGDDEPNVVTGAGAQPLPRGVSNNNWSIGRTAMEAPDAPVTDQWMWFSYLVPGIFIITSGPIPQALRNG